MRRLILLGGLLSLVAVVWLWGFGGMDRLAAAAMQGQRTAQNAMAGALRQLQGGQPGALMALWGVCFAYGFVHAAGPGHGKLVIGSYGLARRVPLLRLSVLAVASSLAQALTAVALVGAGVWLLDWQREQIQGFADQGLAVLASVMIGMIGLWLIWRGARALARQVRITATAPVVEMGGLAGLGQTHAFGPDGVCETCGHSHGPTLAQVEQVRNWRDGLMVVAAVAARPCTGALFLLILTWQIGVFWAGVAGAFVMALGVASVTLVVALAAVSLRESALMQLATGPATARVLAVVEVLAGAAIIVLAFQMVRMGG